MPTQTLTQIGQEVGTETSADIIPKNTFGRLLKQMGNRPLLELVIKHFKEKRIQERKNAKMKKNLQNKESNNITNRKSSRKIRYSIRQTEIDTDSEIVCETDRQTDRHLRLFKFLRKNQKLLMEVTEYFGGFRSNFTDSSTFY